MGLWAGVGAVGVGLDFRRWASRPAGLRSRPSGSAVVKVSAMISMLAPACSQAVTAGASEVTSLGESVRRLSW
ncbi:hypothetical protein DXZ75_37930 [Streptomyces sp. AcE210]|nr:hypothetical protein DXZ75_37930 [Streptomyces sp. AcE210]